MRATSLTAAGPDRSFTLRWSDQAEIALSENHLLHNSWTNSRGLVKGTGTPTPLCARIVVVQTKETREEDQRNLGAKNIITSYGRHIATKLP